jgi:serine/threonine protein kinase
MNDKEKENEKNNDKDLNQFNLTNFKDFEIKKELNISNEYIKIYKVLRKIDKKYYILLEYPLNIVTNNAKNFQKLVGVLEIIKILLKKINHTNVLNIKESFIEKEKSSVIMILELYDNKTIYNGILSKYKLMKERYVPESTLLDYLYNIIEGLSILHKNNIFNINLSPKNIYIDEKNNLKLNPYISLENLSSTKFCNNTYFRIQAPELSKNSNNYNSKTDIWYLGLLIYEITQLESMNNYFYDNYEQIYNYIIRGNYPFNNYYSNDIKELIKLCLQYSQNRRPSAVELLKIIDLYKKNRIINKKLDNLKINKKSNKLQKKINLREEIDKFNQTLAKIKNYDNKSKFKIHRDMTPVITRKHSNYNINENEKYNFLENKRQNIFKKPIKLKACFINNNKLNIPKTGKKFFGIHKNNETMKGYLQTQPFDIKKFVVKNPSYFQYENINYKNNRFKFKKNKSFNIINNIEDNSNKDKSAYLYLNKYNINEKYYRRSNSFNFCKINKNYQDISIYGKNKIVFDRIKTKYYSPYNKKNKKLCKSFYLPYEKSIK